VNVALPAIGREFRFPDSSLQWVVTAYGLTFAGFALLGGRAADLLGRRRVLMAGLAVFTAASLACGLAALDTFLIVMRGIQRLGAALVLPAALSIVTHMFAYSSDALSVPVATPRALFLTRKAPSPARRLQSRSRALQRGGHGRLDVEKTGDEASGLRGVCQAGELDFVDDRDRGVQGDVDPGEGGAALPHAQVTVTVVSMRSAVKFPQLKVLARAWLRQPA
jgi:hypothetical protein